MILYDHFTPFTLIRLEELGFCGQGEAKDFIADARSRSAGACRSTPTAVNLREHRSA
jgi:acetyl-CoA acetyltransferase